METVKEQDLDKQQIGNHIGCMAGFFNIFDRPHILSPKRFALPKRLSSSSSSPSVESEPASERSSPMSKDLGILKQNQSISIYSTPELRSPAPESLTVSVENHLTRSPLTLPIMEFKEGSSSRSPWRFTKEAPRLSLDSRAVVDAKGSLKPRQIRAAEVGISRRGNNNNSTTEEGDQNQRGSPSVIARLMGLEALPPSGSDSSQQQSQKSGLQRSASESRVSREYRFVDSFNFQSPPCCSVSGNQRDENGGIGGGEEEEDPAEFHIRSVRAQPARAPVAQQRFPVRRKSFFDSTDFFPEPRQCGLIHGDLEKVTKMSGFDAPPPNDLETLKQLLEALKLKGLLHSSNKQQCGKIESRNLVFESPIKPARSPRQSRDSSSPRSGAGTRVVGAVSPSVSPRRDRNSYGRDQSKGVRNRISPSRSENSVKSPNRRPTLKETTEQQQRRVSSPLPWRRPEPVQTRNRGRAAIEDESSQADEEMWKVDEYNKEGKTLLERCDKLLQSIAEMAAAEASAGEAQPSPVSVLDASLYHEESSPSPVLKRSLDFGESEDESWSGSMVSMSSLSDSSEYIYISDILRASDCLPQDSDIFSLLEKQQYLKGKCGSRAAAQERRLIFDAVQEIVGRRRRLPPWRTVGEVDKMQVIWSEFQKIRKKGCSTEEEDLVGYVCGVLGRDLSEDGWRDCQVEISEAVLDIERLIFKDLIGETIQHMAGLNRFDSLRRRLVF